MNIGIYFECQKKGGGVYQYALNLLEALKENRGHNFTVFNMSADFPFRDYELPNWKIINLIPIGRISPVQQDISMSESKLRPTFRRRFNLFVLDMIRRFRLYKLQIFLERSRAKDRANSFMGHDLDLIFFHGPSELSFLTNIPAVVPIHDLQHRMQPQFLEVSSLGQWEKREYLYNNIKKSAYKIFADSEVGKEDIIKYYGVDPKKIEVVPFLPPSYLRQSVSEEEKQVVIKKYGLPSKFIFYPAQFWPHKNHRRLILAIKILKDKGINIPLVLVGSKQELWGEFDLVKKLIDDEGLSDQIYFLNYVSNDGMSILYKIATALIMPTFFGPTNIPVVEAWYMGCPVLYSDIRGCREQAGNATLLFDPRKPESIAEKISVLWTDQSPREDLIKKGKQRLKLWTRQDFNDKIGGLINNFKRDGK